MVFVRGHQQLLPKRTSIFVSSKRPSTRAGYWPRQSIVGHLRTEIAAYLKNSQ